MKRTVLTAALLLAATAGARSAGPHSSPGERPGERVIEPHRVEVTFSKTVHILFPAAVRYVDLGSADLIAGIVQGAENVVRVKAAVRDFPGETNFSVITGDGVFYSFDAVYAENPARLNIEMEDRLREDPYGDFAADRMYIRMEELGGETPVAVNRIMYTLHRRNAPDIRDIGCKGSGIETLLKGIYIHGELLFLHLSLRNSSNVSFEIDRVRFRIADRKVPKRTAVQESGAEPVRVLSPWGTVDAKGTLRNICVFRKFTLPEGKELVVEVFERNGGRHQRFRVGADALMNARPVGELKIR